MAVLEDEVKNAVLHNKNLLVHNLGDCLVVYEKVINWKTIADCLVFSKRGIIGIEIKTSHDTLRRLPSQLEDYIRSCRYTYVFCADEQLKGVMKLLDGKHYNFVGVISYSAFNDTEVVAGLVRRAKDSPYVNTSGTYSLLWSTELRKLYQTTYHEVAKGKRYEIEKALPYNNEQAQQIVAQMYVNNQIDNNKPLQRYYFGDNYIHDVTGQHLTKHGQKLAHKLTRRNRSHAKT